MKIKLYSHIEDGIRKVALFDWGRGRYLSKNGKWVACNHRNNSIWYNEGSIINLDCESNRLPDISTPHKYVRQVMIGDTPYYCSSDTSFHKDINKAKVYDSCDNPENWYTYIMVRVERKVVVDD